LNHDSSVAKPIVAILIELLPAVEKLKNLIITGLEAAIEPGASRIRRRITACWTELLSIQSSCVVTCSRRRRRRNPVDSITFLFHGNRRLKHRTCRLFMCSHFLSEMVQLLYQSVFDKSLWNQNCRRKRHDTSPLLSKKKVNRR
jgi:hypothetical protein